MVRISGFIEVYGVGSRVTAAGFRVRGERLRGSGFRV